MKALTGWRKAWRWPWDDGHTRTPAEVFAGLERLRARRARGMVWKWRIYDAKKERGESYEGRPFVLDTSAAAVSSAAAALAKM